MISQYPQIKDSIISINRKLQEKNQVQKIFETPYFICFQVRGQGKSQFLYLGKGAGVEGVWIHDSAPKSYLRVKTRFLEYLRKWLRNGFDLKLELDKKDRIISLIYIKNSKENAISFFWNGRKSYFLHVIENNTQTLSWRKNDPEVFENHYNYFDEVGRRDIEKSSTKDNHFNVSQFLEEQYKKIQTNKKKKSFELRKYKNIQQDLEKLEKLDAIKSDLVEDKLSFDGDSIKLLGKKLKFEPSEEHYSKRNKVFNRLKRFEKSRVVLEKRLAEQAKKVEGKKEIELFENNLKVVKPIWTNITVETVKQNLDDDIVSLVENNIKYIYGKSARANDQIRKQYANKEDWWFHLDEKTSSHVFVKGVLQPTEEILQQVAKILAENDSKEIDIVYTQVKNLKPIKGQAGGVIFKKEKRRRVFINE